MPPVTLSPGMQVLAFKIQEASMQHGDVQSALSGAISAHHSDQGSYGYYVNHDGDGEAGTATYSSNGAMRQAPYTIAKTDGKLSTNVNFGKSKGVMPVVKYLPMDESETAKESEALAGDGVRLVESAELPQALVLSESAATNPLLKIISAGRGSSGYYTKELLERDGPQVFRRGTLGYINHATQAEEAARPEGDWEKLAWVTIADAKWNENGKDGPALYAPVKLFHNRADEIIDKAPFTGASIRAAGQYAEAKTGRPDPKVKLGESALAPDGKPGLIGKLTRADSIDLVTRAGRDGKLLLESALSANQGDDMDKAEIQALLKESLAPIEAKLTETQAENKKLREQLAMADAPRIISEALKNIRLPDAGKKLVVERLIPQFGGAIPDTTKLVPMVEAEAASVARFLTDLGYTGGAGFGARMTEAEVTQFTEKDATELHKQYTEGMAKLTEIFVGPKLSSASHPEAQERREQARKAFQEGRAA